MNELFSIVVIFIMFCVTAFIFRQSIKKLSDKIDDLIYSHDKSTVYHVIDFRLYK